MTSWLPSPFDGITWSLVLERRPIESTSRPFGSTIGSSLALDFYRIVNAD